jgi:diaminohydroxyphosphoribosylaminopyrimidine deaminase/5-amino-6-(5-phosphoribosylamino)uracil reductase
MTSAPPATTDDARFMRRALELAARARGLTSPNPMVGAVVVAEGEIVGEGLHRRAGDAHAEVEALAMSGDRARGATLYVTLEPCSHVGRTPPCAPGVVRAGIRRVVAALGDPNPLVSGRGFDVLRSAGIDVEVGVLEAEAARLNRAFLVSMREGRPHVTLKAGMTLDGKIADRRGDSQWITGDAARRRAHELRSESDAIVVGIETVLRDDPQLTVRLGSIWPREPYRVILDSAGRTPLDARVIRAGLPARTIVAVGAAASPQQCDRLVSSGVTVLRCPGEGGRVDLRNLLAELFTREVRAVLVEGGGEVHMAFLDADLVDAVALFVAPRLLGGRSATSVLGGPGRALTEAVKLGELEVSRVGDDVLIEAAVRRRPATPESHAVTAAPASA